MVDFIITMDQQLEVGMDMDMLPLQAMKPKVQLAQLHPPQMEALQLQLTFLVAVIHKFLLNKK